MSATTKKEVNQLKDKAHKDLARRQVERPTPDTLKEIQGIQWYLQDLDQRYPQFKIGYQTPKERQLNALPAVIVFLVVAVGVLGNLLPNNAPDYAAQREAQQFKDDLNRARGTY
jgi:hypothetical protein